MKKKDVKNFSLAVVLPESIHAKVLATKPPSSSLSAYLHHLIDEGMKKQVGALWLPYLLEPHVVVNITVSRVWYEPIRDQLAMTAIEDRAKPYTANNYYLSLICLALNLRPLSL